MPAQLHLLNSQAYIVTQLPGASSSARCFLGRCPGEEVRTAALCAGLFRAFQVRGRQGVTHGNHFLGIANVDEPGYGARFGTSLHLSHPSQHSSLHLPSRSRFPNVPQLNMKASTCLLAFALSGLVVSLHASEERGTLLSLLQKYLQA